MGSIPTWALLFWLCFWSQLRHYESKSAQFFCGCRVCPMGHILSGFGAEAKLHQAIITINPHINPTCWKLQCLGGILPLPPDMTYWHHLPVSYSCTSLLHTHSNFSGDCGLPRFYGSFPYPNPLFWLAGWEPWRPKHVKPGWGTHQWSEVT